MMYENLRMLFPFDAVNVINLAFSLRRLRESVRTRQSSRNRPLCMANYSAFSTTERVCVRNFQSQDWSTFSIIADTAHV